MDSYIENLIKYIHENDLEKVDNIVYIINRVEDTDDYTLGFLPETTSDIIIDNKKVKILDIKDIRGRSFKDVIILVDEIHDVSYDSLINILKVMFDNSQLILIYHKKNVLNAFETILSLSDDELKELKITTILIEYQATVRSGVSEYIQKLFS
jgi:predicted ribonuclease YlaK